MNAFYSIGSYEMKGRGTVYNVILKEDCDNFDWLLGKPVKIDLKDFIALDVERFAHGAPWRAGETIGILVKPVKNIVLTEEKKSGL